MWCMLTAESSCKEALSQMQRHLSSAHIPGVQFCAAQDEEEQTTSSQAEVSHSGPEHEAMSAQISRVLASLHIRVRGGLGFNVTGSSVAAEVQVDGRARGTDLPNSHARVTATIWCIIRKERRPWDKLTTSFRIPLVVNVAAITC